MNTKITIIDEKGTVNAQEFEQDNIVIGRIDSADIVLGHNRISRKHAIISREETSYIINDLGSPNGTFVNGLRISSRYRLAPGDTIKIGPFSLQIDENCFPESSHPPRIPNW